MVKPWYSLSLVHLCSSGVSDWAPPDKWIIHTRRPKLSETKFLSPPVWVHWFFSSLPASAEAQRGCSRVSGEEGWKNRNAANATHLWILQQRAQIKGRACLTAASAIIRRFDTGSKSISDDDMVSSLLWPTLKPDADTWPARWGALF